MDPRTGDLYPSIDAARKAGVENPVELLGRKKDVERISRAVKAAHRRKVKASRKAKRVNRD